MRGRAGMSGGVGVPDGSGHGRVKVLSDCCSKIPPLPLFALFFTPTALHILATMSDTYPREKHDNRSDSEHNAPQYLVSEGTYTQAGGELLAPSSLLQPHQAVADRDHVMV